MKPSATPPAKVVRCAIYTRKSVVEGLEQESNSLDAQREAAEAFIASQRHEGWQCLPQRYDDGGFTGANTERPALRSLMSDVEAGLVDGRKDGLWVYYTVKREALEKAAQALRQL